MKSLSQKINESLSVNEAKSFDLKAFAKIKDDKKALQFLVDFYGEEIDGEDFYAFHGTSEAPNDRLNELEAKKLIEIDEDDFIGTLTKKGKKLLGESLDDVNEGKLEKLFLQVYPDKSTSDSFIEYDLKTMKITKVNYSADEPELKLDFKKGESITKEWISDFLGESVSVRESSKDFFDYVKDVQGSASKAEKWCDKNGYLLAKLDMSKIIDPKSAQKAYDAIKKYKGEPNDFVFESLNESKLHADELESLVDSFEEHYAAKISGNKEISAKEIKTYFDESEQEDGANVKYKEFLDALKKSKKKINISESAEINEARKYDNIKVDSKDVLVDGTLDFEKGVFYFTSNDDKVDDIETKNVEDLYKAKIFVKGSIDDLAKEIKSGRYVSESAEINEAKIKSDSEFIEYGEKMLKKAHGDDYDQSKADKTLQGILKDSDGDYGKAVGALQGGMAEDVDANKVDENYTVESFIVEAKNISFSVSTDKDFTTLSKALNDKDLYDVLRASGSRTFTTDSKEDAQTAFEIAKKLHIKLGKPNAKDVKTMTTNYED